MKIEIILPASLKPSPLFYCSPKSKKMNRAPWPALTLPMLAALVPKDVSFSVTDQNFEEIDYNKKIDLVAISSVTASAKKAYEVADRFREKGVKIIVGGLHVSAMPEEAALHADAVIIGEAENQFKKAIEDFKNGGLKQYYKCDEPVDLATLPLPRKDILDAARYSTVNIVETSRGCPHKCEFCYIHVFHKTYRTRPVEQVIDEIKAIKGDFMMFVDDNIVGNINYAKKLFEKMIPLNKCWIGQSSMAIAYDDELCDLAAKSGCLGLLWGVESISEDSLKESSKAMNRIDKYEWALNKVQTKGIAIMPSMVFGFDNDDISIFDKTIAFLKKTKFEMPNMAFLTPLPGTALYSKLEKEGRIIERDWSKYDFTHVVFKPKLMSCEELENGVKRVWKSMYSNDEIFRRTWNFIKRYKRGDFKDRSFKHMAIGMKGFISTTKILKNYVNFTTNKKKMELKF